jgi:ubiquinone/menaquinone biosynthesis C-methylase UbiE
MSGAEEAGEYDAMDFSETDRLFAERAAELGGGAKWIVDIGAGNAKIPLAVSALLKGRTRICAVDMSSEMLAVAGKNCRAERRPLHLLVGDAKRLPFRDASVDLVISNSLIHHIPDPGRVFREVARIGRAILIRDLVRPESESEVDALVKRYGRGWSGLQQQLFADSLHAALTLSEVRELLDRSGLASASLKQITDRHWSAERGAR